MVTRHLQQSSTILPPANTTEVHVATICMDVKNTFPLWALCCGIISTCAQREYPSYCMRVWTQPCASRMEQIISVFYLNTEAVDGGLVIDRLAFSPRPSVIGAWVESTAANTPCERSRPHWGSHNLYFPKTCSTSFSIKDLFYWLRGQVAWQQNKPSSGSCVRAEPTLWITRLTLFILDFLRHTGNMLLMELANNLYLSHWRFNKETHRDAVFQVKVSVSRRCFHMVCIWTMTCCRGGSCSSPF